MTYNMLSNIPWTWFIYKLESKYKKTGNIIKSEFPCLVLEAVWTQFEAVWNSFKYRNNGEERSFFGNSKLKKVSRKSYTDVPKNLGSQRSKRICNWNLEIHFIKNTNMAIPVSSSSLWYSACTFGKKMKKIKRNQTEKIT